MGKPDWIESYLTDNEMVHEYHHHKPVYSAEALANVENVSGLNVAKVVVAMKDDKPVLFVLPATRRVALQKTRELLEARKLRLATEDEIRHYFPDCELGAIPPLPHWQGIDIWMDKQGFAEDKLLFQAGTHEDTAVVDFKEWYDRVHPNKAKLSEPTEKTGPNWSRAMKFGALVIILGLLSLFGWMSVYLFQYSVFGPTFGSNLAVSAIGLLVAGVILGGFSFLGIACVLGVVTPILYSLGMLIAPFLKTARLEI